MMKENRVIMKQELDSSYFEENSAKVETRIIRSEIKRVYPFTELGITERTSQLRTWERSLIVNEEDHSQDFIEGMSYVNGVITDLSRSKELVKNRQDANMRM